MRIILLFIFSINIFFHSPLNGQINLDEFRKTEKRVRYTHPDSLLILSEKLDSSDLSNKIFKYFLSGKHYFWHSQYATAFEKLLLAKNLSKKSGDHIINAEISLDLSSCLSILENTGQSLDELLYAKKVFDKIGNNVQKGKVRIAIGELYRKIGEYDKAITILNGGKKYYRSDPALLASFYNRLAAIKSETSQMDSAYFYSKKAIAAAEKSGDISLIAISENEIGYILKHKNKKDSAIIHFQKADSIFRICGMTAYALQSAWHYARLIDEKGEYRKALSIYLKGFRIADKNNWYRLRKDYCEGLRNRYLSLNMKDSVYFYDLEMKQSEISLLTTQYQMNTRMVESMYSQEKMQKEINEKEKEIIKGRERSEKLVSEKKFMSTLTILIAVVLLFSIYMIFFQIKRKRKIQASKQEKEKQNQELRHLLKNNEALVQEISHRVKNNLSVLSGLLGIQKSRVNNIEAKNELQDTIYRIEAISAIHNQLYDTKESASINIKKGLIELGKNLSSAMGHNPENIILFDIDEIELDITRAVSLSMIINELLTNSFKYAVTDNDSKIILRVKKNHENITASVIDSGPGIPEGINAGSSASMGHYLVDILCRQLKANKELKRENNQFHFTISF